MSRTGEHLIFNDLKQSWLELFIFLAAVSMTLFGLVVLYSVGRAQGGEAAGFMLKQTIWFGVALFAFYLAWRINIQALRDYAPWIGLLAVGLLALVLIPGIGHEVNGAQRWLNLGFMSVQVSDFVKIAYLFVLADYLARQQHQMGSFWRGFVFPVGIIGVVAVGIILQPDFGTTALCGAVGLCMLFLAGARMHYLLPCGLLALALFAFLVYQDPIRLERVTSFMNLEDTRADGGYQLWQGILAFGVGGLHGVGLGNGRQQMAFLPEAHTDFVFPIIGEEFGFLVTSAVVLIFFLMFAMIFRRLCKAPTLFDFLLVTGCTLFIFGQALINFGVVTGLLPTKGMSLPFISYGGSNLVATFVMLGLILNCFYEWERSPINAAREVRI